MSSLRKIFKYNMVIIIGLLASLLASAVLLDPRRVFYVDWNNHLWIIEYFGESIKHLVLPDMLNTQQFVGIPFPLFYAQKFYALSGLLSAFLGSAVTIRILVLAVFLLQFFQVYRAAIKVGCARNFSIGIAVLVTWAIYPLTNLYNRSALTEFFAVAFLTCSLASFLSIIINEKDCVFKYDALATGLFFVAAAVTHPLTAVFGGLFLAILGLITLLFCEKKRKPWLLAYFSITAFLGLLVLSPWIYLLSQFRNKLTVFSSTTNATFFQSKYFFPASIDNVFSRLSPFPLDLRAIQKGVQDIPTPYLDAQIGVPLLLLIVVLIYIGQREKSTRFCLSRCERAIIGGSAVMLLITFIESVVPKAFDWMGGFFNTLQFAYRLVTYVNLSLLVMVVILAGRMSTVNADGKKLINICLACCIVLSFAALIEKLVHASAISQKSTKASRDAWAPLPFGSQAHLNELPETFYSVGGFSIQDGFEKGTVPLGIPAIYRPFNVLDGARFGQTEALTVDLAVPTLVITNVQPFPWNHIVVNGSLRSPFSIIAVEGRGAIALPQGSYRLEFVNQTNGIWRFLNFLSWVLFLGWIAAYAVYVFNQVYQRVLWNSILGKPSK